jgi:hypothetical protein
MPILSLEYREPSAITPMTSPVYLPSIDFTSLEAGLADTTEPATGVAGAGAGAGGWLELEAHAARTAAPVDMAMVLKVIMLLLGVTPMAWLGFGNWKMEEGGWKMEERRNTTVCTNV